MSMNQKRHDPFQPLRHFLSLVEVKCDELPKDIDHWVEMATNHAPESRTYINISQSSIEPREAYLGALLALKQQLADTLAIVDGRTTLHRPKTHLEMPIETILRKYVEFTAELQSITEK